MCLRSMSWVRATKVASAPRARLIGLNGKSTEPNGVDLVTLPISLVGEYWPLVSPSHAQLGHQQLGGGEDAVVAAAGTPAHLLVAGPVLLGGDGDGVSHRSAPAWLARPRPPGTEAPGPCSGCGRRRGSGRGPGG